MKQEQHSDRNSKTVDIIKSTNAKRAVTRAMHHKGMTGRYTSYVLQGCD